MNNKNKIVNLGYQLAQIINELIFLLLNIYIYIYDEVLKWNNYGNNYNKIVNLGQVLIIWLDFLKTSIQFL